MVDTPQSQHIEYFLAKHKILSSHVPIKYHTREFIEYAIAHGSYVLPKKHQLEPTRGPRSYQRVVAPMFDQHIKETYLKIINARNEDIENMDISIIDEEIVECMIDNGYGFNNIMALYLSNTLNIGQKRRILMNARNILLIKSDPDVDNILFDVIFARNYISYLDLLLLLKYCDLNLFIKHIPMFKQRWPLFWCHLIWYISNNRNLINSTNTETVNRILNESALDENKRYVTSLLKYTFIHKVKTEVKELEYKQIKYGFSVILDFINMLDELIASYDDDMHFMEMQHYVYDSIKRNFILHGDIRSQEFETEELYCEDNRLILSMAIGYDIAESYTELYLKNPLMLEGDEYDKYHTLELQQQYFAINPKSFERFKQKEHFIDYMNAKIDAIMHMITLSNDICEIIVQYLLINKL